MLNEVVGSDYRNVMLPDTMLIDFIPFLLASFSNALGVMLVRKVAVEDAPPSVPANEPSTLAVPASVPGRL